MAFLNMLRGRAARLMHIDCVCVSVTSEFSELFQRGCQFSTTVHNRCLRCFPGVMANLLNGQGASDFPPRDESIGDSASMQAGQNMMFLGAGMMATAPAPTEDHVCIA